MSRPRRNRRSVVAPFVAAVTVTLVAAATVPTASAQTAETPPPTPVPIPGGGTSPSPFPTALRTPQPGAEPPAVDAASAVLLDLSTGQTLFSLNANERRPIASVTKIMTAYLVMTRTRPGDVVRVARSAVPEQIVGVSNLGLRAGERITVEELLYALLLQSANDAAVALAEHVSGSVEAFVELMNRSAEELGLARTTFTSPNGLDDDGSSTARDVARITRAAYRIPGFAGIVGTRVHAVPAPPGGADRILQNRNALLWLYPGAIGVKTGFTSAAGFCIVATAVRDDERLLAVVLGSPDEAFSDAATLLDHGFAAFERRSLIAEGRELGTVSVDGRDVTVATGDSLVGLVPADARIRRRIEVDPGVRFPPGRGQQIGAVALSVPGMEIGRVPLVVTDVPPPPPLDDGGSWWSRALGAVVRAGTALLDALMG